MGRLRKSRGRDRYSWHDPLPRSRPRQGAARVAEGESRRDRSEAEPREHPVPEGQPPKFEKSRERGGLWESEQSLIVIEISPRKTHSYRSNGIKSGFP